MNPGSAFNCYWEMPFRKHCRVTLTNLADEGMTLFYQINYTETEIPEGAAYFHAQFRRVNPLPYKEVYTPFWMESAVRGITWGLIWHGARTMAAGGARAKSNSTWMATRNFRPSVARGTEDYFCGSFNFENKGQYQEFTTPYAGLPQGPSARWTLRIADAIWHVSLAHYGSDPVRGEVAGDDSGLGLERRRPLPAIAGRYRLSGLLVSGSAHARHFRNCPIAIAWKLTDNCLGCYSAAGSSVPVMSISILAMAPFWKRFTKTR